MRLFHGCLWFRNIYRYEQFFAGIFPKKSLFNLISEHLSLLCFVKLSLDKQNAEELGRGEGAGGHFMDRHFGWTRAHQSGSLLRLILWGSSSDFSFYHIFFYKRIKIRNKIFCPPTPQKPIYLHSTSNKHFNVFSFSDYVSIKRRSKGEKENTLPTPPRPRSLFIYIPPRLTHTTQ